MSTNIQEIKKFPLAESIFPEEILVKVKGHEQRMLAITYLLIHLFKQSRAACLKYEIEKFDPNPGNHACQVYAIKSRHYPLLIEEFETVNDLIIKSTNNVRKRSSKERANETPEDFFKRNFQELKVSEDMLFFLRSYLLFITIVKDPPDEMGYQLRKIESSRLNILSKYFDKYFTRVERELVIGKNKRELSKQSVQVMQAIIAKDESNDKNEAIPNKLVKTMLSDKHIREVQIEDLHPPKFFSCGFFQVKAVLDHLKRENALVCITHLERKERPTFSILLRGSKEGFTLLSDEEMRELIPTQQKKKLSQEEIEKLICSNRAKKIEKRSLSKEEQERLTENSLTIFLGGGDPTLSREEIIKKIKEIGFENVILICAAQEPPYDRATSTLKDVKDPDALKVILEFRDKAQSAELCKEDKPFFRFLHIYTTTLERAQV